MKTAPKSVMSRACPSWSMPCSRPLGSSNAPTHCFSAATPSDASSAQMPSMTFSDWLLRASTALLNAGQFGCEAAHLVALVPPPKPSRSPLKPSRATRWCSRSKLSSTLSAASSVDPSPAAQQQSRSAWLARGEEGGRRGRKWGLDSSHGLPGTKQPISATASSAPLGEG